MAKAAKKQNGSDEFGAIQIKVSEKGAISVYGIRRFPITFYIDEWRWLQNKMEAIIDYGERHSKELKPMTKEGKKAVTGAETI